MTSPSKNYIMLVIVLAVGVLFLVGLLCGRITKRVTRELKDRGVGGGGSRILRILTGFRDDCSHTRAGTDWNSQ
ncbi:Golgi apparatus protein 1-like, partial [Clarias magur]